MDLQANIDALEAELAALRPSRLPEASDASDASSLDLQEYRRYGRQMILPGFGLPAQLRLKKSKVLVVGAGGLGCPVLLYLASAGVGHITIMDHDTVEISNLHRQVLHTQKRVGMSKVDSAVEAIRERNSSVVVQPIYRSLSPSVLLSRELDFDSFDLILDCSDNAATRYLLNDACVQHGKVLVSGAAIRLEGQLVVWNLPPAEGQTTRGPCYRCVFPKTGTERASQNCEDEGVLGTVTGTIGTLMAAEAIKLLTGMHQFEPRLTLYSWTDTTPFRTLKIKGNKANCLACRDEGAAELLRRAVEHEEAGEWSTSVCGIGDNVSVGPARISVQDLANVEGDSTTLLDVRSKEEFSICSLPGFQNLPLAELLKNSSAIDSQDKPVVVLCRRGNDSVTAVQALKARGIEASDVQGGIRRYAIEVDPTVPVY